MRLAAYCRVSTEKEEQLESLENQRSFFEEFAQKHNDQLVEIYADEGISGKQMSNRSAFLKMLADAKENAFDMVVVKDISRFARNTVDFLNATRQLKSLHIEVQFLSNNQTILGNSEFILTVFSALAQEESANLSRRVKFGKKVNAKRGRVPNLIYGYDQMDTFTLAVNEQEAQVVRRIFQMYGQEGCGSRRIALALTADGIPTKKGVEWSAKTIRRMLCNPIYCGILVNNKYETTDFLTGTQIKLPPAENFIHERPAYAIISKELFAQTQKTVQSRALQYTAQDVHRTGRYSSRHLFSTMIRCERCGYAYGRIKYTYRNTFIKWRCTGNNQYSAAFCSNNLMLDEEELLGRIGGYLEGIIGDKQSFVEEVVREYRRKQSEAQKQSGKPDTKKQLQRLERMKDKYKAMYMSDIIEVSELKERLRQLEEQIAQSEQSEQEQPTGAQAAALLCTRAGQLLDPGQWSNAELRQVIDSIGVNEMGRVTVRIKRVQG